MTAHQGGQPFVIMLPICSGITIHKNIRAFDRDKPNTPNSDVQYTIVSGDTGGHFALESSHKPYLVLKKPLDYDSGDREFVLTVTASVSSGFGL